MVLQGTLLARFIVISGLTPIRLAAERERRQQRKPAVLSRSQSRQLSNRRASASRNRRRREFYRLQQPEQLEERRVMAIAIPAGTLVDFGDAPQSYRTTLDPVGSNDGPVHRLVPNVFLGGNVDAETNGVPTATAKGDDLAFGQNAFGQVLATSDEDGVNLDFWRDGANNIQPNKFFPGGVSHIQVHANVAGYLSAWIDYNRDGDFFDVNEQIAASLPLVPGANTLTITLPLDAVVGGTYSRFRFTTDSRPLAPHGILDHGVIPDGEVEDHPLTIETPRDYGDAPASYQTLIATNGASHLVFPCATGVHLGPYVDPDIDGQPTVNAQGDDRDDEFIVNGNDDEDGVSNFSFDPNVLDGFGRPMGIKVLAGGLGDVALVSASVPGFLHAWIDYNRDGDFGDPGEQIASSLPVVAGVNQVHFNNPAGAATGLSYARFRFTTVSGMLPYFGSTIMGGPNNGVEVDGEVEDYQVLLVPGVDHGDAPASYGSASSDISPHYYLGHLVDPERFDPIYDNNALGDDTHGSPDDEDGVALSRTLLPGSIQTIVVTASAVGYLNAWVDFDADGTFGPGEQIFTGKLLNPGANTLTYNVPAGLTPAKTFSRFRFSQTPSLGPTGHNLIDTNPLSPTYGLGIGAGEVEDYELAIGNQDFADAPDGYHTLEGNLGAAHVQDPNNDENPYIGSPPDIEANGQPGPLALGDDQLTVGGGLIAGVSQLSATNDGAIATINQGSGAGHIIANYFGNVGVGVPAIAAPGITGLAVLSNARTFVSATIAGGNSALYEINPATGLPTLLTSHGPQGVAFTDSITNAGIFINDLAVQPLTNTLFGIGGPGNDTLYRIDPATGKATAIGDTATGPNSGGLAFNREGTLYLTSTLGGTGQLHIINPLTAAIISTVPLVYPGAIPNTNLILGLTARPSDNQLFGSVILNDGIVTIDPATGNVTLVGATNTGGAGDLAFVAPLPAMDDEDGVFFDSGLNVGLSAGIPLIQGTNTLWVDSTGSPTTDSINLPTPSLLPQLTDISGYLNAWIDFNRDGDFTDLGEQIAIDLPMTAGAANPVPFVVPANFSPGSTFARFRVSTETGLSALGLAADGEVEDYQVSLQALRRDFGDAPDPSYPTLSASNGASHVLPQVERSITHNGVSNFGFETGLAGWSTGGLANHVEVVTAANLNPSIAATEGTHYALLSSGPGEVNLNPAGQLDPPNADIDYDNSLLSTMFHLDTSHVPATLSFDWNLLTAELTATPSKLDDFFDVKLNGVSILGRSINGVTGSGYPDSPIYDRNGILVTTTGSTNNSSFADGQTGWRQFTFVITQAGDYTLSFQTADQGPDRIFDTGLLVDNVKVAVQPEPQNYLRLGDVIDAEIDGQPTNTTLGDDLNPAGGPDDEDGVTFTAPILPGLGVPILVEVNGVKPLQQAFLDAWIDYNQDGDWNDAGEQILFSTAVTNATHAPQTVPVPLTVVKNGATIATPTGLTRLRVRLSSQGALTPTGQAATGEVEDYLIFIGNPQQLLDYGDAPDNPNIPPLVPGPTDPPDYTTLLGESSPGVPNVWNSSAGGARHAFNNNRPLYLGSWIDFETNATPNVTATGDDTTGPVDDEDGVVFPSSALVPGQTVNLTITANDAGYLNGWFDLDRNGVFDPGEKLVSTQLVPGVNTVPVAIPVLPGGPLLVQNFATYARFRFGDIGENNIPPTGYHFGGEVEDYRVQISNLDFGDAFNDPANQFDYPTLLTHNGARHIIQANPQIPAPILGLDIDAEPDGQSTVQFAANGDDLGGRDDEDGITFLDPLIPGDVARIAVNVTNAGGFFRGWMDYNGDLEWDDDNEQLDFTGPPIGTQFLPVGTSILSFLVPAATPAGPASFRFRLTSGSDGFNAEPNSTIPNVANSGIGLTNSAGNIGPATDVDLAAVWLEAGQVIAVDVDTAGLGGPLADSYLRLFNSAGVQVAANNNGAAPAEALGNDSYLTYSAPSAGVYYIGVSGNGNTAYDPNTGAGVVAGSTGNYLLSVRVDGNTLGTRGVAFNGEVEDYVVNVVRADFGDAPNSFSTSLAANGAMHPAGTIRLGANIDSEIDALPDNDARSDDNLGTPDDEDGVTFAGFTQAQLPVLATGDFVTMSVVASTAGTWLNGWLDYNRNGVFDEPTERVLSDKLLTAGTNTFTIQIAPGAAVGLTYARFRVSSEKTLPAVGTAWDGEVEDYKVQIISGFDFGDAPDFNSQSPPDYSTILHPIDDPDPGPQHIITGLYLGSKIDHDPDGVPHTHALGDDLLDGNDDEDGVVFLDPLVPGSIARVQVTSSLPGTLNGWFDFTRDGDWDDPGEHPILDLATTGGGLPNVFLVAVPNYAVSSSLTFARFRLSSYTFAGNSLGPDGIVPAVGATPAIIPDGEVEDYQIVIGNVRDWGDAPDSLLVPQYPTLSAHNGAVHDIRSGVYLGQSVDPEADGQPTATANGDDAAQLDDEDGITILDPIIPGHMVRVQVNASVPGFMNAWFDFNADGDWNDPSEWMIAADALGGPMLLGGGGPSTFTIWVPEYAKVGQTFARFRFVSQIANPPAVPTPLTPEQQVLNPFGGVPTFDNFVAAGEVEDYLVTIDPALDFGDAPATFGTTLAGNGARHVVVPDFYLGAGIDSETDGVPAATANGDDLATSDDEDGVIFTTPLSIGATATIQVTASAAGKLDAWLDVNGNGTFDPAERIFASQPVNPGVNTLSFQVPVGTISDISTFARFRFSQSGGLGPTGLAPDGEVEDYQVSLAGTAISGRVFEDQNGNGVRDVLVSEPDIVFVIDVSNSAIITVNPVGSTPVGDVNGDGLSETILDDEIAAFIALFNDLSARVDNGTLSANTTVSIVTFVQTASKLDMDPVTAGVQIAAKVKADANTNGIPDVIEKLRAIVAGSETFTNYQAPLQATAEIFTSLATPNGAGFMVFLSDGLHSFPSVTTITPELNALRGNPPSTPLTNHKLIAFGIGPSASVGSPSGVSLAAIDPNATQLTNPAAIVSVLAQLPQSFNDRFLPGITVYLDADNDNVQDPGEATTVTASDDPATPNFDETGSYAFANLPAGPYHVRVAPPAGSTVTAPAGGVHNLTLVSGAPQAGRDFGIKLPAANSKITVQMELLANNGGVPGAPISGNSVVAGQEFFVRISAKDERNVPKGLIGLALDIDWNAAIFDEVDSPFNPATAGRIVTGAFPLLRGGSLDTASGFIDELRGASLPSGGNGTAIGVGTFTEFALLRFRAKAASAASPFVITVGSNGYSTADGAPPATVPVNISPASVTVTAGGALSIVDNSGAAGDARIQFTTPLSQFRPSGTDSTMVRPAWPDTLHYFDVTNTSATPVTLSQFQFNAPNVTITPPLTAAAGDDIVLGAGQTQRFQLRYAPTLPSLADSTVQTFNLTNGVVLLSNSPGSPTVNIALSGASTFNSDINYDGAVNLTDLGVFNNAYGAPTVDPTADINGDAAINFGDLGPFNVEFGRSRPLPLMAIAGENTSGSAPAITTAEIAAVVAAAKALVPGSENIPVQIADLPGAIVGQFYQGTLTLDATAASWGWFVDATPGDSREFSSAGVALTKSSLGRIDLLSVLVHELGHAVGAADVQNSEHAEEVMSNLISTGTRRLPAASNSGTELPRASASDLRIQVQALDVLFAGERTAAAATKSRVAASSREVLFAELGRRG